MVVFISVKMRNYLLIFVFVFAQSKFSNELKMDIKICMYVGVDASDI